MAEPEIKIKIFSTLWPNLFPNICMTLVCEIFLKLEKHQQVAYLVGAGRALWLPPPRLPISFNILFCCVVYFFLQQGPQIFSTSSKVMLSVPNREGALPLLLDCTPFSYLRARLLEPPGDKNMPERCQPVATHQSVAPAVPGEARVFAGMNGSHKQQLAGPYVRAVCMRPC